LDETLKDLGSILDDVHSAETIVPGVLVGGESMARRCDVDDHALLLLDGKGLGGNGVSGIRVVLDTCLCGRWCTADSCNDWMFAHRLPEHCDEIVGWWLRSLAVLLQAAA
jgi:hypothetical protein